MFYVYWVVSAVLVLLFDGLHGLFREPYGWWLTPLLLVAFFVGLVALHFVVLAISAMCVRLDSPPEKGSRYFRFMAKGTVSILLKLARIRVHVKGTEKVPQDAKLFFVCNHQHDFDPVIILSVFPDHEIGFIGKKEIYTTMPLIARIMHKLHCLP
ncbi:MAG: 1-acyl-sn-glycerol-3-phosphate acyltransferase, partial [Clostridia bacterium]|nr:1-acyl-sn-glycerol-3-phosphate acyltransferase [Clostridia bacterium]